MVNFLKRFIAVILDMSNTPDVLCRITTRFNLTLSQISRLQVSLKNAYEQSETGHSWSKVARNRSSILWAGLERGSLDFDSCRYIAENAPVLYRLFEKKTPVFGRGDRIHPNNIQKLSSEQLLDALLKPWETKFTKKS